MSSFVSVTSEDINLVKQFNQERYIMVKVVNREFKNIATIQGQVISGGIDIDGTSDCSRTGNITIKIGRTSINGLSDFSMSNYIRIYSGIKNNRTQAIRWYLQGTFLINQNGLSYNATNRTLSLSLADLMTDLTGERAGVLHAYSTIAENSQKIDSVMKNVLKLCNIENYNIEPICVLRNSNDIYTPTKEEDYLVPYDLEFGTGVTAHEILDKCVKLYPYWEIKYTADGTFICQRKLLENDTSFPVLNFSDLRELVLSESISRDYTKVKNYIEVWGKDGHYYGEAKDETADSPFNVNAYKIMRAVYSGENYDNIYDRYKDPEIQNELILELEQLEQDLTDIIKKKTDLQKKVVEWRKALENPATSGQSAIDIQRNIDEANEKLKKPYGEINLEIINKKAEINKAKTDIANNIDIKGDDMAKQWAEQLLYENCRMQDTLTLETVYMPFLNDVNFKISYRTKEDGKVSNWVVKNLSHDLGNNTTTITAVRFYAENCDAYLPKLSVPVIVTHTVNGTDIIVSVEDVMNAQGYKMYVDGKYVTSSTGNLISYTLPDSGIHTINITAYADRYQESDFSISIIAEESTGTFITTNGGDIIVTNNNERIMIEGDE